MDQLNNLLGGFADALTPLNLLWLLIGALLGTAVGVLPGLGSAMAVALLLPVTFSLDPVGALIMFAGVYYGGLFGDSIAGILLNTPNSASAIAGSFEGHRMAKDGRAAKALAASAIGDFTGGLIATTLVVFFSPLIVQLASAFGPAEYFALAVFAFIAISWVVAESFLKGIGALAIGLLISIVGIDGVSGTARFTLGVPQLFDGVSIVVVTVGLLAMGEVFFLASRIHRNHNRAKIIQTGRPWLRWNEFREALPGWLRGTAIGVPFGAIPAGGAEVPSFLAYTVEKRLAKRRKDPFFGSRGSIRGVAGPEAAGNATAGSAMGALLAIGLPTSATAAIMLAAFRQYGMQPGPLLFERSPDIVWALLASLFLGLIVLLALNLPFAPLWAKLLKIPAAYLYSGIAVLACLGVYSISASTFDLVILLSLGALGFLMRRFDMPIAPVLIGVILGPLAETEFRRAVSVGEGDPLFFITSPFTIALYSVLALGAVIITVLSLRRRGGAKQMMMEDLESDQPEQDTVSTPSR
ncbi:tripartite tricarboxylate transporter permease [Microbacterium enclense]|uniref:Putative tricarboxylic transport membrane protein n=1 Tax=Microbacterium enclense TaxID=993073 RepID=A0A1G6R488_9MICO|nr:tripartite tricarboxylate transporter permease [Microbacterium enclense]KSU51736.1 tripartite tricarboxylate transporter TctA [Microbacterium enclense]SDC99412.1 putative tricarboxylic transport membrane protein [Microbacterium enclense]